MSTTQLSGRRDGRVPPHNLEAEESLLGAMLLSSSAIADSIDLVSAEQFYRPANAHVYDAIAALYASGDPVDPVTVAVELERAGVSEAVGGLEGLHRLQMNTPASSNATKYASIVRERFMLRQLISVASEIAEIGYSQPDDAAAAVDIAENMVFQIADGQDAESMSMFGSLAEEALDLIIARNESGKGIVGTPTGFFDLDEKLSGLQPSSFVVVGARPAMGKTSFILNIASHAAIREQKPVLVFSLEMGHVEISQRILSAESRIDTRAMSNGRLKEQEWPRITQTIADLKNVPLWIDDNPNPSILDIRSRARRLKSSVGDLGLVIVDYLQLMTGRDRAESRQVEVAEISRGLKILARELRCPVVGVSQLSRALEARSDKRPLLSDLRESGSIEQDADVVLFLYRDEVYQGSSDAHDARQNEGIAEVIIAKHRNGPIGTVELNFVPRYTSFRNLASGVV